MTLDDSEPVAARKVKTGDTVLTGRGEQIVMHAEMVDNMVVLHHSQHCRTEMGPDMKVRVRRRARQIVHVVEEFVDEARGGHIWVGVSR